MRFATPYAPDHKYADHRVRSIRFATENLQDTMTQRSDANDTDINIIVNRYLKTNQLPKLIQEGIGGDFTQITDYRQAVEMIQAADAAFAEVPADIRKQFDNDPAKFIEFATNPENLPKLREMGLAEPEKIRETTLADLNESIRSLGNFNNTEDNNGNSTADDSGSGREPASGTRRPSRSR